MIDKWDLLKEYIKGIRDVSEDNAPFFLITDKMVALEEAEAKEREKWCAPGKVIAVDKL